MPLIASGSGKPNNTAFCMPFLSKVVIAEWAGFGLEGPMFIRNAEQFTFLPRVLQSLRTVKGVS